MTKATHLPAWAALQRQADQMQGRTLQDLMKSGTGRDDKLRLAFDGISLDLTHTHIDGATLNCLCALAEEQKLAGWRDEMFSGEKVNITENRAALHTALRDFSQAPLFVDGQDIKPSIASLRAKMKSFSDQVRYGQWLGATGKAITDVVNIGIGGSDLGPRLVSGALRSYASGPRAHYVANVDASAITQTLAALDPETTLFLIVSKTFKTQETLLNARAARAWIIEALGQAAVLHHFVGVSSDKREAMAFGLDENHIFPMWDWIGGRFSLWSSVGLSCAIALGWDHFEALLRGASAMDQHFKTAPLDENMPVLLAMIGLWYRNFKKAPALAILPYSERLRELPRYLQQLDMESNGKSVTREGEALDYETGPVLFGECGSSGQHSFHQWLHQGTTSIPTEFIGIKRDDSNKPEHHRVLNAHMLAQIEALAFGGVDAKPEKRNGGNKGSSLIWIDTFDPYHLGLLLALYEHKIFCQGVMWGINSFDQFGVELGKDLARNILDKV